MSNNAVRNNANTTRLIVTLLLVSTIAAGITVGPGGASANTYTVCSTGCDATTIQTAIDMASAGDTVLVGPGTYEEKLLIPSSKTGLRLLAEEPGMVLVDASNVMTSGSVLGVRADDALVRGIELVWEGSSGTGVQGVWISGDGVRFEDNTLRLAGSTSGQLIGIQIQRASGLSITGNTLEGDLVDLEEMSTYTANGVYVQGGTPAVGQAKDNTFTDNTFTGWATRAIFLNEAEETTISGNTFTLNNEGVLLCNTKATHIMDNTFTSHFTAIQLCDSVEGPVLHKNQIGLSNQIALLMDDRVTNTQVDARLNDWGLHEPLLLAERIDDEGTGNEVLQIPYLDAQGEAEPPLVRIQQRPGEPFFSVQDALDAASPGDVVLVPASNRPLDPLSRQEALTITKEDLTLCSSVGGSPLCAEEHEAGHWQLSRSEWVPAPAYGHGQAILLDDEGEPGTWGSTSFFPPGNLQAENLEALSLDLFLVEPTASGATCGAGAPRLGLGMDLNGDGTRDGTVTITNLDITSGCPQGEWIFVDFMDETQTRWDLHTVGGPNQRTQEQALAWINDNIPQHEIVAINAIMDNGATAVIDNQRINNWVLGEPQDIACHWSQETHCRWNLASERTILDAQGTGTTLNVAAPGVEVSGFSIRNTGDGPLTGVELRGNDNVLRGNDIQGNFLPTGHDGSSTVNQIGIEAGLAGATGQLVEDNKVHGWDNIGILLSQGAGEGIQIKDNNIKQNRWHGILAEGPTPDKGPESATVTGNEFSEHGHSALRIGARDPGTLLVRENTFALTNVNAVTVQERVEDTVIDLRLNDWGVYDAASLPLRVDDESGTNHLQQVPFIDITGEPEPPLVERVRPGQTGPVGNEDLFLSFQDAVDDPLSEPGTRIQALPARTEYPGPVTIIQDGLTLCTSDDGTGCNGDGIGVVLGDDGTDTTTITVLATNTTIKQLTLKGGKRVLDAEAADGLLVRGNTILTRTSLSEASHGIRINDTLDARVEGNQFTGNLYTGSTALELTETQDAHVLGNRIVTSAVGIAVEGGQGALVEDNQVLSTPGALTAGETTGIRFTLGSDHSSMKNTVYGAATGLLNEGSTNLVSDGDRFLATVTGASLQTATTDGPAQQPDGMQLHNASLAGALLGLHVAGGTYGLLVEATCNDWGVYQAEMIETQRIRDDGTMNEIRFTPYVAPGSDGLLSAPGCLSLPVAGFSFQPSVPRAGQAVTFESTSEDGSRPIVEKHWDFGDGRTLTDTMPFEDPQHAYQESGTYLVTLKVTDSDGNIATTVEPVLVGNQAPFIVAPNMKTGRTGDHYAVPVLVVDLSGDNVTLTARGLPSGAELVQNESIPGQWELDWTPGPQDKGTHRIELVATDTLGLNTTHLLDLIVWDALPLPPTLSLAKHGVKPGPAMPGQPLTFQARLVNNEDHPVQLELEATTNAGWATSIHGGDTVTVPAGGTHVVNFDVIVGDGTWGASWVNLFARSPGASDGGLVQNWHVKLPVETGFSMDPVQTDEGITGEITVQFIDGTPAKDRPVRIERTYQAGPLEPLDLFTPSHISGETDENGVFRFSFPDSDREAHTPGTHRVIVDIYTPVKHTLDTEYTIGIEL